MSDSKVTIKTADVWTKITHHGELHHRSNGNKNKIDKSFDRWITVPAVLVHGLTESEVHEAAALLAKSREVCKWERDGLGILRDCAGESHSTNKHSNGALVTFCPSCGRRVSIKEV